MLCPTNSRSLRTRGHPVLMGHLLEVGLDPGRGDSAQDHFHLLDQAEEEDRRFPDCHLPRRLKRCSQLSDIPLCNMGTCHELDLHVDAVDEELDY